MELPPTHHWMCRVDWPVDRPANDLHEVGRRRRFVVLDEQVGNDLAPAALMGEGHVLGPAAEALDRPPIDNAGEIDHVVVAGEEERPHPGPLGDR